MKSKRELVKYWLAAAEKDLPVMQHLFDNGDYHYCLFIGHLALEKVLKAVYVNKKGKEAPYKHGLLKLAKSAGLELTTEQQRLLDETTGYNIAARYPDAKFDFYKQCTQEYTEPRMRKILEFCKWAKEIAKSD